MQRFLVKKSVCAALCITIAFSVYTYTAAAAMGEAGYTIVAEVGSRATENIENTAEQAVGCVKASARRVFGTALSHFMLVNSEISKAVIPEP